MGITAHSLVYMVHCGGGQRDAAAKAGRGQRRKASEGIPGFNLVGNEGGRCSDFYLHHVDADNGWKGAKWAAERPVR